MRPFSRDKRVVLNDKFTANSHADARNVTSDTDATMSAPNHCGFIKHVPDDVSHNVLYSLGRNHTKAEQIWPTHSYKLAAITTLQSWAVSTSSTCSIFDLFVLVRYLPIKCCRYQKHARPSGKLLIQISSHLPSSMFIVKENNLGNRSGNTLPLLTDLLHRSDFQRKFLSCCSKTY